MKLNGLASEGMNDPAGYLSLKTTVESSGAVTLSTMSNQALRALEMPCGGKMMRWNEVSTSLAVSGVPSWNLTPWRILNVNVLPPSVGLGISVHRSHTKLLGLAGSSGSTRISTL